MDQAMTSTQLAKRIAEYRNPLAQIESRLLKALGTDEVIDDELLQEYAKLFEKRQLRQITREDMRINLDSADDPET